MIRLMMNEITTTDPVVYLGPEGTYSHAALLKLFGSGQACTPVDEISHVFDSVQSGQCRYGLVPVENSSEGSVTQTLDSFGKYDLSICGEVMLRIQHCLLASAGTEVKDIKRIVSHQQSLGQCRHWLDVNLPAVDKITVPSNAEAARIAGTETGTAAIAGKTAAELYGLSVLEENLEDVHDNTTRFAIICKDDEDGAASSEAKPDTCRYKSSLIIFTRNEPGALFNALEPFKNHTVNLIKLESRPSRKEAWSYSFFVDIEGHCDDANIQEALNDLTRHALEFRVLGSYLAASND
jgi:chorismate mutase/prephenate dehydratase